MDADKLNEAAKREAYNGYSGSYKDRKEGFIKGANWLMQQPLTARLTDKEKEKHRNTYNRLVEAQKKAFKEKDDFIINMTACQLGTLTQIFGKELFNQPTEV